MQSCCNTCSMFRINSMIGTLKCSYPGLSTDAMAGIMDQIQKSIRQKVNKMSLPGILVISEYCRMMKCPGLTSLVSN